jgi:hypothetical protein
MSIERKKIKIGIVSEHANNDGKPIACLLERYFPNTATFQQLHEGAPGSRLETPRYKAIIKTAYDKFKPNLVIIIRDLDKDANKKDRLAFFEAYVQLLPTTATYLLFVYMIEELISTDLNTLNGYYNVSLQRKDIPKQSKSVVDHLEQRCNYDKSDMRALSDLLDKQIIYNNYTTWKEFIDKMAVFFDVQPVFS